jgi:hypothetical protein
LALPLREALLFFLEPAIFMFQLQQYLQRQLPQRAQTYHRNDVMFGCREMTEDGRTDRFAEAGFGDPGKTLVCPQTSSSSPTPTSFLHAINEANTLEWQ